MDRLIRVKDICGCPKTGRIGYLPISKSSWWAGVAEGRYPAPVKLGARTTCWRESEVLALVSKGSC
jgi:predicted DNA-binding transcriptional regulator AlpA